MQTRHHFISYQRYILKLMTWPEGRDETSSFVLKTHSHLPKLNVIETVKDDVKCLKNDAVGRTCLFFKTASRFCIQGRRKPYENTHYLEKDTKGDNIGNLILNCPFI
jgi:hypothetical protein